MDKTIWDMDFIYNGPVATHMSCHMGDTGARAFCNMIGDQPMFYIDDSADSYEDEDDLFVSDIELIETLRSRIDAYDRSAKSLSATSVKPTQSIFDAAFRTEAQAPLTLDEVLAFASKSNTFKDYKSVLDARDVHIVLDKGVATSSYNRAMQVITLNPHLSMEKAVLALCTSMRQAYLHKQGTLINPLRFQPEDAVLINRLLAADAKIMSVEIAWELRLAGAPSIWDTMMGGADYDLCKAYGVEAMTNFRSLKNGLAARSTFEKWFVSGRCKSLDRDIIQVMLGNKVDLIFNDEDTSRTIATDMVARLGARPTGKNYLSSIVTQIMVDGLYTDVRDRSNANFLWFITFEKRMREVEQELQSDGKSNNDLSSAKGSSNGISAQIAQFPSIGQETVHAKTGTNGNGGTLFYLDHFRAL